MAKKIGQKTKLTPELQAEIVKYIQAGNYARHACLAVGISERTYYNWIEWGEERQSGVYFQFMQAIKKAEAQAVARNVAVIQKAAIDTWQAAAWWLERTQYEHFGRKDKHDITSGGEKLQAPVVRVIDKEAQDLLGELMNE